MVKRFVGAVAVAVMFAAAAVIANAPSVYILCSWWPWC